MKIYYDLNIPYDCNNTDIIRYIDLGYTRMALNLTIDVSDFNVESNESIKKSKQEKTNIRTNLLKKLEQPKINNLLKFSLTLNKNVKLFSRITLKAADCAKLTNFIREFQILINDFDIIACECQNLDVTSYASDKMVVDIITFDLQMTVPQLSHSIVKRCKERGVIIEVNLSHAITSIVGRSITSKFINDLSLIRCPPIITVTSGANNLWLIRGFLGLTSVIVAMGWPEKYSPSLNKNSEMVVEHALARKYTIQGSAAIIKLNKLPGVKSVTVITKVGEDNNNEETSPQKKKMKLSE